MKEVQIQAVEDLELIEARLLDLQAEKAELEKNQANLERVKCGLTPLTTRSRIRLIHSFSRVVNLSIRSSHFFLFGRPQPLERSCNDSCFCCCPTAREHCKRRWL